MPHLIFLTFSFLVLSLVVPVRAASTLKLTKHTSTSSFVLDRVRTNLKAKRDISKRSGMAIPHGAEEPFEKRASGDLVLNSKAAGGVTYTVDIAVGGVTLPVVVRHSHLPTIPPACCLLLISSPELIIAVSCPSADRLSCGHPFASLPSNPISSLRLSSSHSCTLSGLHFRRTPAPRSSGSQHPAAPPAQRLGWRSPASNSPADVKPLRKTSVRLSIYFNK